MHIWDGLLSAPVIAATAAASVGAGSIALWRLRRTLADRTTVLMGMMAAFIFAAQMVNFPLVVLPASGHLIGAVLAAVLLGPWAALLVMALVLLIQCLLYTDGGLLALGANVLNLGVIAGLGGWLIYNPIRNAIGGRNGVLLGAMLAAWLSVPLSAIAFSVELAASGQWHNFSAILSWMILIHAAIGVGEALITGLVLRTVLLVRPDLVYQASFQAAPRYSWAGFVAGGVAVAIAVAAFLSPFASSLEDGLEYVGGQLGFQDTEVAPRLPDVMPDYAMPGVPMAGVATSLAGVVGTLIVFSVALLLARAFRKQPLSAASADLDSLEFDAPAEPGKAEAHAASP